TLPPASGIAKTWSIGLDQTNHVWTINGQSFDDMRTDFQVPLDATQKWKIVNNSPITHYFHLHEEQWQTILRDGRRPPPWERGLEDTWKLDPGESIVVKAHFTDYTGLFMIHCHMLDHEDHGLMAQFEVIPQASPVAAQAFARHRVAGMQHGGG